MKGKKKVWTTLGIRIIRDSRSPIRSSTIDASAFLSPVSFFWQLLSMHYFILKHSMNTKPSMQITTVRLAIGDFFFRSLYTSLLFSPTLFRSLFPSFSRAPLSHFYSAGSGLFQPMFWPSFVHVNKTVLFACSNTNAGSISCDLKQKRPTYKYRWIALLPDLFGFSY